MSKKTRRHNPEKVNSAFIPKGYRLLNVDEVGTYDIEDRCIIWIPIKRAFSLTYRAGGGLYDVTYAIKKEETSKKKEEIHNPDKIPLKLIPKGWRLLFVSELNTGKVKQRNFLLTIHI
jgi:hypothetical protein